MPKMAAYLRVSTVDQVQGHSLEAQHDLCLAKGADLNYEFGAEWVPERFGDLFVTPGIFSDNGVSASKVPFLQRPAVRVMLQSINPGDFIIANRLDRAFRSVKDFCDTLDMLIKCNVRLVVCDKDIDTSTPNGMALAQMLIVFSQWESAIKGQRFAEAAAVRKQQREGKKAEPEKLQTSDVVYAGLRPQNHVRAGKTIWTRTNASRPPSRCKPKVKPILEGRMFVYIRNSAASAHKYGLGLENQKQRAAEYAEKIRAARPEIKGETLTFHDDTVSAYAVPFQKRPKGKQISGILKAGDHLVFSRLDRAFRSILDCLMTLERLDKMGVTVHFADMRFDSSKPMNRPLVAMAALFCQMESEMISARKLETNELILSRGGSAQRAEGLRRITTEIKIVDGTEQVHKKLEWNKEQVVIMRYVYHLYYFKKVSWRKCFERVEQIMSKRDGRPVCPVVGVYNKIAGRYGLKQVKGRRDKVIYPPWMWSATYAHCSADKNRVWAIYDWYENRGLQAPDFGRSPRYADDQTKGALRDARRKQEIIAARRPASSRERESLQRSS